MPKRKKLSPRTAAQKARMAAHLERRRSRREEERVAAEKEQTRIETERIPSLSFSRKLDWATKHIETLRQTTALWLGTDAYGFQPHTNPVTGRTVVRAKIRRPPAPELALIIGDSVHALRATLDHLALELAIANYQPQAVPSDVERSSEFVIIGEPDEASGAAHFDRAARVKLKGIQGDALSVIKRIQPYRRGVEFAADPLWIIHELDRIDKHRRLNLTTYAMGSVGIGAGPAGFAYIGELHMEKVGHDGPVEDGAEVAAFTARNSSFQMNFKGDIALSEASLSSPVLAVQALTSLRDYISNEVVPLLTPFLAAKPPEVDRVQASK